MWVNDVEREVRAHHWSLVRGIQWHGTDPERAKEEVIGLPLYLHPSFTPSCISTDEDKRLIFLCIGGFVHIVVDGVGGVGWHR